MFNISKTENLDLIKQIITNPKLFALTYGQSTESSSYEVEKDFEYLLIQDEQNILGCFQIRALTKILVEIHIYLLPEYWGQNISVSVSKAAFKWLKTNTTYQKAFTDVPKVCRHVRNLMKRIGGTQCGYIDNGVIYNNKLQGLMLFEYDLKRIN